MNLLPLTFIFPLIGFVLLALLRDRISERLAALIGVGTMGLSALSALFAGLDFVKTVPQGRYFHKILWQWMQIGTGDSAFMPSFGLQLDGLSLVMLGMITGVGFLIHVFAAWYMRGEAGFERFFSYFNLFVASMLLLVLGDNLLVMFLGWEGVGLCSYLLIGFYLMARTDQQFPLRLPPDLRERLENAAKESGRSKNAEAVYRLEQSFNLPNFIDIKNDLKSYPIDILLIALNEKTDELELDVTFHFKKP